jgi:hypothetical protein
MEARAAKRARRGRSGRAAALQGGVNLPLTRQSCSAPNKTRNELAGFARGSMAFALHMANQRMREHLAKTLEGAGWTEVIMLAVIAQRPEIPQTALAWRTGLSRSRMTELTKEFETAGLVTRRRHATHGTKAG